LDGSVDDITPIVVAKKSDTIVYGSPLRILEIGQLNHPNESDKNHNLSDESYPTPKSVKADQ